LGRRPWFAFFFLRALFFRAFFAMGTSRSVGVLDVEPPTAPVPSRGRAGARVRMDPETPDERRVTSMAEEIRAEMVANVWKVVAATGDTIAEGDTLVILESMKMEIPVLAEVAGTLTELAVNEGDVIQEGDLIAVIG
jgi:acetyl-CoA carboxylase biotin carboxyl carrier protein